eukprot:1160092-Pelagomonas_calceolata.AAC.4
MGRIRVGSKATLMLVEAVLIHGTCACKANLPCFVHSFHGTFSTSFASVKQSLTQARMPMCSAKYDSATGKKIPINFKSSVHNCALKGGGFEGVGMVLKCEGRHCSQDTASLLNSAQQQYTQRRILPQCNEIGHPW